jgi:hypothetical protein
MHRLYRRTAVLFLASLVAVAAGLPLVGCGDSNPSGPSGQGVSLQGVVLTGATGVTASDRATAAVAKGNMVVTVQEKPSITSTVGANGTFELESLPAGTITLVFTIDGTIVGTITLTGIPEGAEVKIVVQVTPTGVILIEIKIEGPGTQPSPGPSSSPGTGACLIEGGKAGSNIELEGNVASGTSSLFKMDVQGNRSSGLVDVNAASAAWRCVGQSDADCKAAFRTGNKVHVRGLLTTCSSTAALVNATEVKVQKP